MKVLFFIESLKSGGKERLLIELLKGLSNNNIECELVITDKDISYTEFEKLKVKTYCIEREKFKKDIRLFYKFYQICRRTKPDIIHVWGNVSALYSIPAKVILNIPLVNNQIIDAPNKLLSGLLSHRTTFPFSDLIIANSQAGLLAYNSPLKKSIVIYNGLDLARIRKIKKPNDVKLELGIKSNNIVGMLATFSTAKDYKTYIRSANIILNKFEDATFLCLGSGDSSSFEQLVDSQHKERVLFPGFIHDIESVLNICDIGVLATYTEGISMALMEFMALGKPVIATKGGGTKELVCHGETGFLVSQKSPKEIALKIEYLLKRKEEAVKMGGLGKKRINEVFSLKKMTEEYISVYKTFGLHS
jgi:glycosyltransferase involved in cell wall biosynthesis